MSDYRTYEDFRKLVARLIDREADWVDSVAKSCFDYYRAVGTGVDDVLAPVLIALFDNRVAAERNMGVVKSWASAVKEVPEAVSAAFQNVYKHSEQEFTQQLHRIHIKFVEGATDEYRSKIGASIERDSKRQMWIARLQWITPVAVLVFAAFGGWRMQVVGKAERDAISNIAYQWGRTETLRLKQADLAKAVKDRWVADLDAKEKRLDGREEQLRSDQDMLAAGFSSLKSDRQDFENEKATYDLFRIFGLIMGLVGCGVAVWVRGDRGLVGDVKNWLNFLFVKIRKLHN